MCYFYWYHVGVGQSVEAAWKADKTKADLRVLEQLGDLEISDESIQGLKEKPDLMAAASQMFVATCALLMLLGQHVVMPPIHDWLVVRSAYTSVEIEEQDIRVVKRLRRGGEQRVLFSTGEEKAASMAAGLKIGIAWLAYCLFVFIAIIAATRLLAPSFAREFLGGRGDSSET